MFVNVPILKVGRDVCPDLFEQVVHGVELGALFGKPDQDNVQGLSQSLAAGCQVGLALSSSIHMGLPG